MHAYHRGRLVPIALLLFIAGSIAPILSTPPAFAIELGTRLRITERDATTHVVGTFAGLRGDTLLLTDRNEGEPRAIALPAIATLERSSGLHRHTLAGAGLGLFAGAIVGAVIGGAARQDADASAVFTGGADAAAVGAVYIGAAGAIAGALVGTVWRTEIWRSMPTSGLQVGVGFGAEGAPEVRAAKRF